MVMPAFAGGRRDACVRRRGYYIDASGSRDPGAPAGMRLSEEKARQLNALVWRDRMRRIVPIVAVAMGAVALLTFFLVRQVEKADRTLDVLVHQATVVHIKKSGNSHAAAIVEVRLDDGREERGRVQRFAARSRHGRACGRQRGAP